VDDVGVVSVTYFTDPFCPWSWAAEPSRRRLEIEFGDGLRITYVICGMAQALQDPAAFARTWLDASAESGMPVDPRGILEDPPASTNPAGLAVKAVAEQGQDRVGPFLRRLRQAIMVERRRLDRGDPLLEAAREAGGLDIDRLKIDFGSNAIVEALGADFDRARAVDGSRHADGAGRVLLPSLEFTGEDGAAGAVYGPAPYERWREAALAAGAEPVSGERPGVEEALRRFGELATAEVAAACDLPTPRAAAELWRLALEWRVRPRRVLGGELWALGN
jgi:predicted DsbA family dithiol-disulfide isomerase